VIAADARSNSVNRMRRMKFPRLLLALSVGLFATAGQAALKPGDSAPDFTVQAATGGKDFSFSWRSS